MKCRTGSAIRLWMLGIKPSQRGETEAGDRLTGRRRGVQFRPTLGTSIRPGGPPSIGWRRRLGPVKARNREDVYLPVRWCQQYRNPAPTRPAGTVIKRNVRVAGMPARNMPQVAMTKRRPAKPAMRIRSILIPGCKARASLEKPYRLAMGRNVKSEQMGAQW